MIRCGVTLLMIRSQKAVTVLSVSGMNVRCTCEQAWLDERRALMIRFGVTCEPMALDSLGPVFGAGPGGWDQYHVCKHSW